MEKLYLNEKERLQRKQEKSLRELASIYKEFESLRKELVALKAHTHSLLEAEAKKTKAVIAETTARI